MNKIKRPAQVPLLRSAYFLARKEAIRASRAWKMLRSGANLIAREKATAAAEQARFLYYSKVGR